MEKLQYGTKSIGFEVVFSNRKTLGISVRPDLSVEVKAPENATREQIFKKVGKRAAWILEQQRFFLGFEPRKAGYLYKSGESHYYLGRQYLLKIESGKESHATRNSKRKPEEVHYKGSCLLVLTENKFPENVKKLLDKWYRERAKLKFAEYAEPLIGKFKKHGVEPKSLFIQNMKYRWGSCSAKGNIILNPELIKAPKPCIEYVINHELCHLVHRNHTKAFFALQRQEMPDWGKWKNKLEDFMA